MLYTQGVSVDKDSMIYHRIGEPGGPGCHVGVLSIEMKSSEGNARPGVLLTTHEKANELELLRTIASKLGVIWGKDDLGWWAALANSESPSWSVWRQDDNGNNFLVKANLTKTEAEELQLHFEKLGHKQMYWVSDEKCI